MTKILFFSKNKKTSDKITEILKSKDYQLQSGSLEDIEKYSGDLNRVSLAIFDISSQGPNGKDFDNNIDIKTVIKSINGMEAAKLMICHPGQLKSLLDTGINMDDFIFYPNIESELLYRVEFLLTKNKKEVSKNSIKVDDMVLNPDKYELTVNNVVIELTYKEFELLKILLQNQNNVLTRNNLFSTVWDYDFYGGSRTVDVHIRRLRSKIPAPYNLMIKTIRNVGYLFSPQM